MEYSKRALIIIPAADQVNANQAAMAFDPTGGAQTFTVPLSSDGQNVTHYWASVQMREGTFQAVQQLIQNQFPGASMIEYNLESQPTRPQQVLTELGLQLME